VSGWEDARQLDVRVPELTRGCALRDALDPRSRSSAKSATDRDAGGLIERLH